MSFIMLISFVKLLRYVESSLKTIINFTTTLSNLVFIKQMGQNFCKRTEKDDKRYLIDSRMLLNKAV